jgi:hypothetical protein
MAYPSSLDVLTDPAGSQQMNDPALLHSVVEKKQNDAIEAIQAALGLNPQGGSATVVARLNALDSALAGKMNSSAFHQPFGVASLDSGSRLVENVDASHIDAGTIALARLPVLPASQITSGVFALAQIPSLPASQVGSGVLAAARIPTLDASVIGTGTIAAARLPSSVTANANAVVVADVAARDAIPSVDRADGKLVVVRSPWTVYAWRADSSVWVQVGGPGFIAEPPLQADDQTDYLNLGVTTFQAGTNCGLTFKGPQSGRIEVAVTGHLSSDSTNFAYLAWEIRTGTVIGSGTVVHAANTEDGVATGGAANIRIRATATTLVPEVLTPGADYNIRCMYLTTAATFDVFSRQILVRMVH